jgi:assimilatory nitrate reductase catalytic subunit
MIESQPKFMQGVFSFSGAGYDKPITLCSYTIAADKRAQPIYLRAGNSTDVLVSLSLSRDGELMRLFPVGAKAAAHVQLAVVEDIAPESRLDIAVSAPAGIEGVIVLDFGLVEI